MPKHISRMSSTTTSRSAGSLIDWREPEANASVLDWRERAREFGLVPIEEDGAVDDHPVVEPPDRLLEEEEQEAFDDQPLAQADQDAPEPEELDEPADARLPQ